MESIFDRIWRLGPAGLVLKAIIVAVIADALLLAFILLRRTYRKRYFARRDARVFELRKEWNALISGKIPFASWRNKPFDRRIVETIVLDVFEAAGSEESARLLQFLRVSGLIENAFFDQATDTQKLEQARGLFRSGGFGYVEDNCFDDSPVERLVAPGGKWNFSRNER